MKKVTSEAIEKTLGVAVLTAIGGFLFTILKNKKSTLNENKI